MAMRIPDSHRSLLRIPVLVIMTGIAMGGNI